MASCGCIENVSSSCSSSSSSSSTSSQTFQTSNSYAISSAIITNPATIQKPHKMQRQGNHIQHVVRANLQCIEQICHYTSSSTKTNNNEIVASISTSLSLNTCDNSKQHHQQQQHETSSNTCNQLTVCWKKVNSKQGSSFKEKKIQTYLEMAKVKKHRVISEKEMIQVLHLSQQQACKALGCSLSTLKRRFYELKDVLGLKRWPQYFHDIRHLPIFNKLYPMSLQFILNEDDSHDSTSIDSSSTSLDQLFSASNNNHHALTIR